MPWEQQSWDQWAPMGSQNRDPMTLWGLMGQDPKVSRDHKGVTGQEGAIGTAGLEGDKGFIAQEQRREQEQGQEGITRAAGQESDEGPKSGGRVQRVCEPL